MFKANTYKFILNIKMHQKYGGMCRKLFVDANNSSHFAELSCNKNRFGLNMKVRYNRWLHSVTEK